MRKIKIKKILDRGDIFLSNLHTPLSISGKEDNQKHKNNQKDSNGRPHTPVLSHKEMLFNRSAECDHSVSRNQSCQHEQGKSGYKDQLAASFNAINRKRENDSAEGGPA
jgi:hypothetical protein